MNHAVVSHVIEESKVRPGLSGVLVVVDMQPSFSASTNPNTIEAVGRELRSAMEHNDFIVVLEYEGHGCTNPEFIEMLRNYHDHAVLAKTADDGSALVAANSWRWQKLTRPDFRVVGVNTDACVEQTVRGLSRSFPQSRIIVVNDACNTDETQNYNWSNFFQASNVYLQ